MRIAIAGDNALIIHFADDSNLATSLRIQEAASRLQAAFGDQIVDLVPGFTTLLLVYSPRRVHPTTLRHQIKTVLANLDTVPPTKGNLQLLPVYYSEESGWDLARVAHHSQLSIDEVIHCHSSCAYRVMAIGFAPGFAYLGELDERLIMPRLASPRLTVPQGAVAIANRYTAVYPQALPGGWNLIGRCPAPLFDITADPPMTLAVGDRVHFYAISRDEFQRLGGRF